MHRPTKSARQPASIRWPAPSEAFAESTNLAAAATAGILVNVAFGLLAILAIITLIPRGIGRMEDEMEETEMAVSESYNQ